MLRGSKMLFTTLLLASGVTACSLDDRQLSVAPAGIGTGGAANDDDGGGPSTGGKSAPSEEGGGSGGNASAGGDGGVLDGGTCPDCEAPNIVYNADFDVDTDGWDAEPDGEVAWASLDAAELDWSGSISVVNDHVEDLQGMTAVGARQCAPAIAGKTYELGAKVTISLTEGSGSGHLNVRFFQGFDCDGAQLGNGFTTASGARINDWEDDHGETTAPPKANSVAIRLVATKPLKDPSLKAVFDEIRVIEK